MNYGVLKIVDGTYAPAAQHDDFRRRAMVRVGGALQPAVGSAIKPGGTTFLVDLHYHDRAYSYGSGSGLYATEIGVSYSKSFKRLASGGNVLKDAKEFVARFSGCEEAQKLRGRIIALSRIRKSISGESFRFSVEAP